MLSSVRQTKTGIIICVLFCFIVVTSGFSIMDQGDRLLARQPRARMPTIGTSGLVDRKGYPAHTDFLKQLINYLELVGRK